ncbi:uncharacterized protein V6R79_006549 [Siganus canaliculatus]
MHVRKQTKSTSRSTCVKLYLCSNPEDSVVERRALRESVFPRLREHFRHTLGLDVRVIDPFESSDPKRWPDENTRQQLIQECRESSAGPFLLALVGHQYGIASLPDQVEVSEYELLLQEGQQACISTQELERWYHRDENCIPPSYCLRPPPRHTNFPPQTEMKVEEEEKEMKAKADEVRKIIQATVSLCVHDGLMTPERAQSFYRSALDADLRFALDVGRHDGGDITGRCLVYIHKVINAKGEKQKRPMASQPLPQSEVVAVNIQTPSDEQLFSELCDVFLPALITSSQLLVYTTATECDRRHGYTTARRRGYADSLCQQVYSDLVELIDDVKTSDTREESQIWDALTRGRVEQEELRDVLSRLYEVVRPEEEKVRAYVQQREQQHPLVVTGGPCTGKAVLMAHCARQIKLWLPDCDPVVVTCFCHLSINPSPKRLLSSLCHQISSRYHSRSSSEQKHNQQEDPSCGSNHMNNRERDSGDKLSIPNPGGLGAHSGIIKPDICLSELQEHLSCLLSHMPSPKQPLVLILDGLDHLEKSFGPQIIRSFPSSLPPSVRLILTMSPNQTQVLQAFNPDSAMSGEPYVCVPLLSADRKQCAQMLTSLLSGSGRRVTSGQQVLVNQGLTSCCRPLYARLLHLHTSLWCSDSDLSESSVPDGVHSSISALLDHLEQKHGSTFVASAVSYLSLSRTGLTEVELTDLLSHDGKVLSEYDQQGEGPLPSSVGVPQIDVERLLLDLRMFLVRRTVAGSRVWSWMSRHFKLVVAKRYLSSREVRRQIHAAMADYFSDQWAFRNTKPHLVCQKSCLSKDTTQADICVEKQPSSRPLLGAHTMRKVLELPHHLSESNKWEEVEYGVLTSLGFHQALVRAGLVEDLVAIVEGEEWPSHCRFSRERALLVSILRSYACLLRKSPQQLFTVMETSLLPYLGVFPVFESYVGKIRKERAENGGGLGTVLCPAPSSLLSIQSLKCDAKTTGGSITQVACTEGGILVEVTDDGTAWLWQGVGSDIVKLSLSCEQKELKFSGVRSSGQFFLLSTQANTLFLWDVTNVEMFQQLKELEPESSQDIGNKMKRIEGFAVHRKKVFIWWRGERSVRMFDASTQAVTHFLCQSSVTCLTCSSNGSYMCCGQEEGTVSVFDTESGSLLGICSNSNHSAVTTMVLCEEKWELACVDRTGTVSLFSVAAKTQPPRFVKENFTGDNSSNILNTDESHEFSTLLVCQSQQVTLWDMNEWELLDQFLAPHGRAFTHAVLSQDGHLFLALLDTCPFVLVWSISTGECVLSLETMDRPRTLLRMASDVVCIGHGGSLTVWDSEMVGAAAAAQKMKLGVKDIVAEQTGEWFYTSDGSEVVFRWRLETGRPHDSFLHDDHVEKLRLSPDDLHLVTLSAGEIYVWRTETGENILRLSGSKATDILITPNNNFGVSISRQRLSRVWKLAQGSIVCSINLYLSDAQVSPESTFLIGRRSGDLLAASLWSGSVSKRFSCVVSSEDVVAFQTLSTHPDFVVVMAASGAVFTWKVSEETVCMHFQLPCTFHCQPQDFQMSSDGSYALLSTNNGVINLLDLSRMVLCSIKAEGAVDEVCLDKSGQYIAYVCCSTTQENSCVCSPHARPVLTVVRLADGERLGSVSLSKNPLVLISCERQCVFVGFDDGSVGVYSISDVNNEEPIRCRDHLNSLFRQCPFDRASLRRLPLATANIKWP